MPIGPLMVEHRLIERMIVLLEKEIVKMRVSSQIDTEFMVSAIDFIWTYTDHCHHGKEEGILFRDLKKKPLSLEHVRILKELEEEHIRGREVAQGISAALEKHFKGDQSSVEEIICLMEFLVNFYPKHIEKEDKHFFIPCMAYFTKEEQAKMLAECLEFDRQVIHEKYTQAVEQLEQGV